MRILRILPALPLLVALCDCQKKKEDCPSICLGEPSKPTTTLPLGIDVSSSTGWDSVEVEVFAGKTVEGGSRIGRWILKDGSGSIPGFSLAEGDYSGRATYRRTGDTLEKFDGGSVSWSAKRDECDCTVGWSANGDRLNLKAR